MTMPHAMCEPHYTQINEKLKKTVKTKANKKPAKTSKRRRSFFNKNGSRTFFLFVFPILCPFSLLFFLFQCCTRTRARSVRGRTMPQWRQTSCCPDTVSLCGCVRMSVWGRARSKAEINANKDNSRVIRFSARCPCSLPSHTKTHLIMCHSFCCCYWSAAGADATVIPILWTGHLRGDWLSD